MIGSSSAAPEDYPARARASCDPSPPRGDNHCGYKGPAAAVTTRSRAPSPYSRPGTAFVLPAYGERGHPVAEQFETTLDKTKRMFFERRVSIFQVWQLFIMWLAFTGLLVFIASVIGFRHVMVRHSQRTTPRPYTHVFRPPDWPKPGEVNGTCDVMTTCQGEAECVGGQCVCRQPPFAVVGGICVYNSTKTPNILSKITYAEE
ncbi:hypothetical protein MTO96_024194 [Rhipicephalus appendiculatus]